MISTILHKIVDTIDCYILRSIKSNISIHLFIFVFLVGLPEKRQKKMEKYISQQMKNY